ncbi:hypothetical protein ARMSODRAFT_716188 [Armillaria solidipes]|uniref:Uncharacterized protein n=1 Tax=Armillaria solidipes TaxID=1076256 RepID=A0A2H3BVY1_9AGAR|nr:hypothetical protein ARMSODRAFT_716188 [Armillaria solidipes]
MSYVKVNGVILDSVRLSRRSRSILSAQLLRAWNLPVVSRRSFFVAAYERGVNCGGASIEFMVSEELTEDICLGSDWYTFLRELVPSGHHDFCEFHLHCIGYADRTPGRCRFLHDTYESDSLLRVDTFADGVPALSRKGLRFDIAPSGFLIFLF